MKKYAFLTLFPEVLEPYLNASLLGRAQAKGLTQYRSFQIRDFASPPHFAVDDASFGGGEGMVLKPDILYSAWEAAGEWLSNSSDRRRRTVLLSPQGPVFNQKKAKELMQCDDFIFVCGHYEGVDERFIELCVNEELSIGDYILTGGELAALVVADAVTRLLPGVVGNPDSIVNESLEQNLLKYPVYTRPREFRGYSVPSVLLQGDHQAIARWREQQREERTRKKRPDLLE